jgi:hypothetical protein
MAALLSPCKPLVKIVFSRDRTKFGRGQWAYRKGTKKISEASGIKLNCGPGQYVRRGFIERTMLFYIYEKRIYRIFD